MNRPDEEIEEVGLGLQGKLDEIVNLNLHGLAIDEIEQRIALAQKIAAVQQPGESCPDKCEDKCSQRGCVMDPRAIEQIEKIL